MTARQTGGSSSHLSARLHSEEPQCGLDPPDPDLDALRLYVADRLADLYPRDYHVYMRRWRTLAPGDEPGPLLGFREWWRLVQELEERTALAAMIDATDANYRLAASLHGGVG